VGIDLEIKDGPGDLLLREGDKRHVVHELLTNVLDERRKGMTLQGRGLTVMVCAFISHGAFEEAVTSIV